MFFRFVLAGFLDARSWMERLVLEMKLCGGLNEFAVKMNKDGGVG